MTSSSLPHGWIILNKPAGLSSAQAVGKVRRIFNKIKAGHAGTLDPLASGVLPIALGEATKTISYVMSAEKSYRFTAVWGAETQTDDTEGQVTITSPIIPGRDDILAVLPEFTGQIQQVPPAYSAVKVNGKRAYALARKHHQDDSTDLPELQARTIMIYELVLEQADTEKAQFRVRTGKGAYIRSLARDLGRRLGSAAHVGMLERLSVGRFHIDQAISLDSLQQLDYDARSEAAVLPVKTVLDDIPAVALTAEQAQKLRHGQTIHLADPGATDAVHLACHDDRPVALTTICDGICVPVRVFNL